MPLELISQGVGEREKIEKTLIFETLSRDITTANYYELVAWCERLGLKTSGSKKEVEKRLLDYYGLKTTESFKKANRVIEIKSARQSEYFDVKSSNEKYITLRGKVVISMRDKEKGVIHEIHADKIIFNQTRNLLTAEGNLEYRIFKNNAEEVFKGESLSFNMNTWEGVFYRGMTEKQIGTNKINFYFYGDEFNRKKDDTVILKNGNITSCENLDNPHYHISAKRIWLLAPGEWAIENAILYVGRIPLMYVPFFFYPGDRLFFNPVMGYREREGNYIQTTTYLVGRKQKKEDVLSFLKIEEESNVYYKEKIKGLFLRKTGEKIPSVSKNFLKVMLDAYSRLGVFSGIEGDFKKSLQFKGGIGFSRDIFLNETTSYYTPYYIKPDGSLSEYWNTTDLLGLNLPFRFGFEGTIDLKNKLFSLKGSFETYSDPAFPRDFYNRSEGFSLDTLFSSTGETKQFSAVKKNLNWFLNSSLNFSNLIKSDFIRSFNIPLFSIRYQLRSKESANTILPSVDPMRYFYYPINLKLPEIAMNLRGDFFSWKNKKTGFGKSTEKTSVNPKKEQDYPGKGIKFLTFTEVQKKDRKPDFFNSVREKNHSKTLYITPLPMENLPVHELDLVSNINIGYQANPKLTYETLFDTSSWQNSSDVDYSPLYSTFQTVWYSGINGNFNFLGKIINLSDSLSLSGTYNSRLNKSDGISDTEWINILESAYKQRQLNLKNILSFSLNPFIFNDFFKGSKLKYDFTLLLYKLQYMGISEDIPLYNGMGPSFTKDSILTHRIAMVASYSGLDNEVILNLQYNLPPLEQKLTTKLSYMVGFFTSSLQTGISLLEENSNPYLFDPCLVTANFRLNEKFGLAVGATYDLNEFVFSRFSSTLTLFDFSANLIFQSMYPINPYGDVIGTEEEFLPSVVWLKYKIPEISLYFWKNRINFEMAVATDWHINLQKYADNEFSFKLKLNLTIYKFLDLSFSSESYNKRTYLYIPAMADRVDMNWVNPLYDLVKSFNFFHIEDRYASSFKLRRIALKIIHHLHDWDVYAEYSGKPTLSTNAAGVSSYIWEPAFSIFVKWNAIPQIKSTIKHDTTGWMISD